MSDYSRLRRQILMEVNPEQRAVDEAYAAAGPTMDLAVKVYATRESAGLTQTELARSDGHHTVRNRSHRI